LALAKELSPLTKSKSKAKPFIDPTLLFRFEVDIRQADLQWGDRGLQLPETCRIPSFGGLADRPVFADVRLGWSQAGIGVQTIVNGKRQLPWCRDTRLEDSDGVHLWIDTRCSPGIHRATQYCHRFLFMPAGGGTRREKPLASLIEIHRARGNPKPIAPDVLGIKAFPRHDGYELGGLIPTDALTGFDPRVGTRIAFYYAVIDRELGWQTLAAGPEYPIAEDPSLWAQAVLAE